MVLAPCPQPTSATLAPLCSLSTTPSSAGSHESIDDVVCPGQVHRTVRVRQAQRLLFTHGPLVGVRVELHVAACALVAQPFADVALVGSGALRQFRWRQRALRQFAVQPEPVTDQHQRRTHRGAEITNGLAEEFVEFDFVDSHVDARLSSWAS